MPNKFRLAILATTLAAVLALPASATAQIEQFSLSPEVQLGPEGASATTTVTVQCPEGFFAGIDIEVVQNNGGRLARADSDTGIFGCTGEPQTVPIELRVFSDFALKQGKATATARVTVTNPDTFEQFGAETGPVAVRVRK